MGFSNPISKAIDKVGDLGQDAIDTTKDVARSDLGKAAIIAATAYATGGTSLAEEGAAETVAADTAAETTVGEEAATSAADTLYPSANDAMAADNIDVGGGFNPATGAGDAATAEAAAATGTTSSAAEAYGGSTEMGAEITGQPAGGTGTNDLARSALLGATGSLLTGLIQQALTPQTPGGTLLTSPDPTQGAQTAGTVQGIKAIGGSSGSIEGVSNTLLTARDPDDKSFSPGSVLGG